jgi:hypothetical protein
VKKVEEDLGSKKLSHSRYIVQRKITKEMKHIKLFEEYSNALNEGAIPVYPPGNPYKPEASIQWTGFVRHFGTDAKTDWKEAGQSFTMVCDVDYDMYTADPQFRSKAQGTWKDKSKPLFTEKYPRYREVEFDLMGVEDNKEKPNEPWLRISDKNGVEFLIHPFHILDIQKGSSMKDRIHSGSKYLIKSMRGKVVNYKDGVVFVKLQDGSNMEIPIADWRKANYTEIEENKKEEEGDSL